jgi:hypothetical protein
VAKFSKTKPLSKFGLSAYNEFGVIMGDYVNIAKDTSTRFHPEIDLQRLRAFHESLCDLRDPYLAKLSEETRAELSEFYANQLTAIDRVIARPNDTPPNAVPCDLVNFMHKDAPDRTMTKLGGLPYWPESRPWPKNWRGKPLSFLGQINFRDSTDIVGELPGEILVMFINAHDNITSHWLNPTNERLIAQGDVPAGQRIFGPMCGVFHRSYDIPGKTLAEEASVERGIESFLFDLKIGGIPWGHNRGRSSKTPFLFQMESPCEQFDDDGCGFTMSMMTCQDWHWPFSKQANDQPRTFDLYWWAAHLKQNGKLSWSWA